MPARRRPSIGFERRGSRARAEACLRGAPPRSIGQKAGRSARACRGRKTWLLPPARMTSSAPATTPLVAMPARAPQESGLCRSRRAIPGSPPSRAPPSFCSGSAATNHCANAVNDIDFTQLFKSGEKMIRLAVWPVLVCARGDGVASCQSSTSFPSAAPRSFPAS